MQNIFKIFFKNSIRRENGYYVVGAILKIHNDLVKKFNPENNSITLTSKVTPKMTYDEIIILKPRPIIIPKKYILKIELSFE